MPHANNVNKETMQRAAIEYAGSGVSQPLPTPEYRFFCQLAHGSPTGIIHGFSTVKQLYNKIAECFDISPSQILFCTLNTHKLDMNKLLCCEVGLNDFLFAHVKGQPKEIYIRKDSASFGLTLTDNGCGIVIIKRVHPNGLMDRVSKSCGNLIQPGDHIERIDDIKFTGRRHFHVAAYLQSIPIGQLFKLRLISPERSPIYMLNPRYKKHLSSIHQYASGKRTLRFKHDGQIEEGEILDIESEGILKINQLLDDNLGFEDNELAYAIYSVARDSAHSDELKRYLMHNWPEFDIPDRLIVEMWRVANFSIPVPTSSFSPSLSSHFRNYYSCWDLKNSYS